MHPRQAISRIYSDWVYGGFLGGLVLFALSPLVARGWTFDNLLVWLCLPTYMVHQFEEHDRDRFRIYFNKIAHRKDALSLQDVFFINVVVVWPSLILASYLACYIDSGWGSIAAALLLVNALIHIAQALKRQEYNPGLYSAAVLFLPLSIAWLNACRSVTTFQLGLGFTLAITVHGAILVYVRYKLKRLTP